MSSDGISGVGNNPYLYYAQPVASTQPVAGDSQGGASVKGAGQSFQARVQATLADQNHRIQAGVESGALSQDVAARLYDAESGIQSAAQSLEGSSSPTFQDQSQLLDKINQANAQIFLARHPEIASALGQSSDGTGSGLDLTSMAQRLEGNANLSDEDKQRLTELLTRVSDRQRSAGQTGAEASVQATGAGASTDLASLAAQLQSDPNLSDQDKQELAQALGQVGGHMLMAQEAVSSSSQASSTSGALGQASSTGGAGGSSGVGGAGSGGGTSSSDQLASLEQEQAQLQQELATAQADPSAISEQIASLEGSLEQVTAQIAQIQGTSQSS